VKKEKETQKEQRKRATTSRGERDWQPLFTRLQEATDWALDIAKHLAGDITEDVDSIERTRGYLHAWLEGRRVDVDLHDVLTTLAVLFAAIEIDLGIDSSPLIQGLALADRMLHLPGAARDESPTVVIRTPIRRRNAASSVFTQLAA
jgi:hypothetical protein